VNEGKGDPRNRYSRPFLLHGRENEKEHLGKEIASYHPDIPVGGKKLGATKVEDLSGVIPFSGEGAEIVGRGMHGYRGR